jgi:isocitrate dehydrogenase
VAAALEENEERIIAELDAAQGSPQDLGGYYRPDPDAATRAMCPSATLNGITATI